MSIQLDATTGTPDIPEAFGKDFTQDDINKLRSIAACFEKTIDLSSVRSPCILVEANRSLGGTTMYRITYETGPEVKVSLEGGIYSRYIYVRLNTCDTDASFVYQSSGPLKNDWLSSKQAGMLREVIRLVCSMNGKGGPGA